MREEKQRIIQEYVPGKQVTLAHIIANPKIELCEKLGIEKKEAIGIMTITPAEGAIVAADIALKTSTVKIGFLDRFSGSLVITGNVSAVEEAVQQIIDTLVRILNFSACPVTRS
ncbi:MAG: Microcompartments protein [Caldanaerobacter subterraneus]|jgi:ethanolamine utilization protein EutS|uniref:Propanediol utilization protein n=1 Tax=Caldanaerobacter subterraneus TaxID=911092 RepID=A0A117KVA9_9THEO|nr:MULTISPECIES: BMC domain-containing protein [Caldanaerobacter]KUK07915.1 MAG: Microcompartments protein [Caldanaerobacter subterraneus]MDI3519822.1 ethanolamine utilization protein EutS [Caldanaerobacter sp.]HBT49779.1 propanediol utilization protein [Caldanaerobacter subterraneus]